MATKKTTNGYTPFRKATSRKRSYASNNRNYSNIRYSTSSSTRRRASSNSGYTYSSYSSHDDSPGCTMVLAIVIMIVFLALILWSFNWDWVSYTRKMHQRVDWSWLKYIFYPVTIGGFLFGLIGLIGTKSSLPKNKVSQDSIKPEPSEESPSSDTSKIDNDYDIDENLDKDIHLTSETPLLSKEELKKEQYALQEIFDLDQLKAKADLLTKEALRYDKDEKIGGLIPSAFVSMNDYYVKKQTEIIMNGKRGDFGSIVGALLMLLTELDEFGELNNPQTRVKFGTAGIRFKHEINPIISMHPDFKIIDIRADELLTKVQNLIESKLKGESMDITFNSLLHK